MKYIPTLIEKILVARYMYKIGKEYISDQEYDAMIKTLPESHPLRYLLWEDVSLDDVEKILNKLEINVDDLRDTNKKDTTDTTNSLSYVQLLMSKFPSADSMQMVTDFNDVYKKYIPQIELIGRESHSDKIELVESLKMDGWNITCYYTSSGKLIAAHTRGRTTNDVTICTNLMEKITPNIENKISEILQGNEGNDIIRVTGELVLQHSALPILRERYPKKSFSNVRNSVSAFVHESIDIEEFKNMVSYYAYSIYSLNRGGCPFTKINDVYNWLSSAGFYVPPRYLIEIPISTDIYNNNATLNSYVDTYYYAMEKYYKETFSQFFECDGLVLQPNVLAWNDQIQQIVQGSFGDGLLAIKARYWAEKVYKAKVARIEYPKARYSRSVMAIVEPVATTLGQTVQRVPLINLQRAVIENDVRVGDTIEFIYHSNQLPVFSRNLSHIKRTGGNVN